MPLPPYFLDTASTRRRSLGLIAAFFSSIFPKNPTAQTPQPGLPLTTMNICDIFTSMSVQANKNLKLKYNLNQEVVYPLHGVGKIESIEERDFKGVNLLYYIIYIDVSDMRVMVPVDKADDLGIRAIVDLKESKKALKLISEKYEPVPSDWKARYQMNLDLLKSGSVHDIATVVRTLYHRSKIKELPILERKLFDSALRLLIDEISFSLKKEKVDVEELIFSKMEEKT